jgi:hypothetical protein
MTRSHAVKTSFVVAFASLMSAVGCGVAATDDDVTGATSTTEDELSLTARGRCPDPPTTETASRVASSRVSGEGKRRAEGSAASYARTLLAYAGTDPHALAVRHVVGLGVTNSDLDALVFLVMEEATRSMSSDLKQLMAEVKEQAAKKNARGAYVYPFLASTWGAPLPCASTAADLDRWIALLSGQLDSLTSKSDVEALRLQLAMDRLSKLMLTLSNLLKKTSETGSSIVHNMK